MEAAVQIAAPFASAAAEGAGKVGAMLLESAGKVATGSGGRASPTFGLGLGAAAGAGYSLYRCVQASAAAADASAAQVLADAVMPSPELIKDALDRVAGTAASSNRARGGRRQRRHSWTAGAAYDEERQRQEAALASLLVAEPPSRGSGIGNAAAAADGDGDGSSDVGAAEGGAFSAVRSASSPGAGAPVTPVTSPESQQEAVADSASGGNTADDDTTQELQRQLAYKLAEVRALQRQHALALSALSQEHAAASKIARKWRERSHRQTTRELLRSASDAREAGEVAKGSVATEVAQQILARHPDWVAHEAAAGVTRVVKIHTVLAKPGSVRRTSSWGTPRAGDNGDRTVDFFLFEFAVQLPPRRLSRSHTYNHAHTPQQPPQRETLEPESEPDPELAAITSPSYLPYGQATPVGVQTRQGSSSPSGTRSPVSPLRAGYASPTHEDVARAAVDAACADADTREMSMTVRFSYGHAKHEAMEAAGLFEGAWPPVVYPPHRTTRTLAARLLGGRPSEEEEREHAVLRSEEMRQYYERVFRLPAIAQRTDLEELVRWVGDGPETIESHADDTALWESPQPIRTQSRASQQEQEQPPSSPLETPSPIRYRPDDSVDDTPSESVRSYAHATGLFLDPAITTEQVD